MDKLLVIKIGGQIIDDDLKLQYFLYKFSQIKYPKILIHGGGKIATKFANDLGIEQKVINGRRITDKDTLNIVIMTYAGLINKTIVAKLQANRCNAIGLSGADANLISSKKRVIKEIDYGFVGDITEVNVEMIIQLLNLGLAPVISAITHDSEGLLLNTNADSIANEIAKACSKRYAVDLIYLFEKSGVLKDINDDQSYIPQIDKHSYHHLLNDKIINEGMLPKLQNAFEAIDYGVNSVSIGKAEDLDEIISSSKGTKIIK